MDDAIYGSFGPNYRTKYFVLHKSYCQISPWKPLVFLRELSFCRSPPRHICHQHNNNSWKSKWANRSSSTILTAQEPLFLYSLLFPSVFLDSVVLVVLVIWVVLELLHFVWTLSQSRLIYLHFFFFFVILENYRFFFVLECGSLHQKYKSNIC